MKKNLSFLAFCVLVSLVISGTNARAQEKRYSVSEFVSAVNEAGKNITVFGYARVHPIQIFADHVRLQFSFRHARFLYYSLFDDPAGSVIEDPFVVLESHKQIPTGRLIIVKGITTEHGHRPWKIYGLKVQGVAIVIQR